MKNKKEKRMITFNMVPNCLDNETNYFHHLNLKQDQILILIHKFLISDYFLILFLSFRKTSHEFIFFLHFCLN